MVAVDDDLAIDHWLAVTPPRVSKLVTAQELIGSTEPVLLDWTSGLAFPCQRPFSHSNGVAEVPQWRIVPDAVTTNSKSKTWQAAVNGGLLTSPEAVTSADTVATYLDHDWSRDWGSLQRFEPLDPTATPASLLRSSDRRWGWTTPGPMN